MCIYNNTKYTPYTYLIGWSKLNKFYYGVRYAKKYYCLYETGCHPDDLWKTYFTSSNLVEDFRKQYGEPDIIQIRKIFDNSFDAQLWEEKVIRRLDMIHNDVFINKNVAGRIHMTEEDYRKAALKQRETKSKNKRTPWNKDKTGIYSEETLQKMRGRVVSEETRERMRKPKNISDERRKKLREPKSEEQKEKIRQTALSLPPREKQDCQYCNKSLNKGKNHKTHEDSCWKNPKNIITCPVCNTNPVHPESQTCSVSCANKIRPRPKATKQELTCNHCGIVCRNKSSLKKHLYVCKTNPDNKRNCEYCNTECYNNTKLLEHKKYCSYAPENINLCDYCGTPCKTKKHKYCSYSCSSKSRKFKS